ncbi:hypothetical protein Pint_28515 [Pistacia integerrima]|uniref:Uncharacterized protein n=1 Tax=Pistacia integerrima TaxID=434235 RepID=A0ACC0YQW9_9ROSI|nr:hypothetical protein Pint_28515 [Pistacia integerrima]
MKAMREVQGFCSSAEELKFAATQFERLHKRRVQHTFSSTHNSGGHGPHASSKLHGAVIPRERKWNISERKKKKQYPCSEFFFFFLKYGRASITNGHPSKSNGRPSIKDGRLSQIFIKTFYCILFMDGRPLNGDARPLYMDTRPKVMDGRSLEKNC